jgi:hypothetical protein
MRCIAGCPLMTTGLRPIRGGPQPISRKRLKPVSYPESGHLAPSALSRRQRRGAPTGPSKRDRPIRRRFLRLGRAAWQTRPSRDHERPPAVLRASVQPLELTRSRIERDASQILGFPPRSGLSWPAHNGVVAGSGPAGPTIVFRHLRKRVRAVHAFGHAPATQTQISVLR